METALLQYLLKKSKIPLLMSDKNISATLLRRSHKANATINITSSDIVIQVRDANGMAVIENIIAERVEVSSMLQ